MDNNELERLASEYASFLASDSDDYEKSYNRLKQYYIDNYKSTNNDDSRRIH